MYRRDDFCPPPGSTKQQQLDWLKATLARRTAQRKASDLDTAITHPDQETGVEWASAAAIRRSSFYVVRTEVR